MPPKSKKTAPKLTRGFGRNVVPNVVVVSLQAGEVSVERNEDAASPASIVSSALNKTSRQENILVSASDDDDVVISTSQLPLNKNNKNNTPSGKKPGGKVST